MARRRSPRRSVLRKNNYVWIATGFGPTSIGVTGNETVDAVISADWETLGTFEDGCVIQRCLVSVCLQPDTTATLFPVGDYNAAMGWSLSPSGGATVDFTDAAQFGARDVWGVEHASWIVGGVGITAGFLGTNMVVTGTKVLQDLKVRRRINDNDEVRFTINNDATSNSDIAVWGSTRVLLKLP